MADLSQKIINVVSEKHRTELYQEVDFDFSFKSRNEFIGNEHYYMDRFFLISDDGESREPRIFIDVHYTDHIDEDCIECSDWKFRSMVVYADEELGKSEFEKFIQASNNKVNQK
jgi:hypothetical protein